MPKLHDIQFLLSQIRNIVKEQKGIEIEESLMDIAESLSKYGVAPRYPNEIEVDENQVRKALTEQSSICFPCDVALSVAVTRQQTKHSSLRLFLFPMTTAPHSACPVRWAVK